MMATMTKSWAKITAAGACCAKMYPSYGHAHRANIAAEADRCLPDALERHEERGRMYARGMLLPYIVWYPPWSISDLCRP